MLARKKSAHLNSSCGMVVFSYRSAAGLFAPNEALRGGAGHSAAVRPLRARASGCRLTINCECPLATTVKVRVMHRNIVFLLTTLVCSVWPAFNAAPEEPAMTMTLTSSAFRQGGEIPARHTCQGGDVSPPLEWSGVPSNGKSLALIVDDPDAPDPAAPKTIWVHWVLYNIPPGANRPG